MKRALICGVGGQDGALLAKLLLDKHYEVIGTSRDAELANFGNLVKLGIRDRVRRVSMTSTDFRSVLQTLTATSPDEIYNLAGQTSVGLSFQQPVEALESIATGTMNLLECVRFLGLPVRLYSAGSSECFGDRSANDPADEMSAFRPRSPYGVAKSTAHWAVANYREAYGLFACSGILFNHESALRPERFVTKKIVSGARRIAEGSRERLTLGNLDVIRDWGCAAEYVDAMWRMLQVGTPGDYVIATGRSHTLQDFVATTFAAYGLEWRDHVDIDRRLFRALEIRETYANPEKAAKQLGWRASVSFQELIARLVASDQDERAIGLVAA